MRREGRRWLGVQKAKDRLYAGRDRQSMGEACATMPTSSKSECSERVEQSCGAAGKGRQGIAEALGKDLTRTVQCITEEAADAQEEQDRSPHAG
jgi:hypothetical protein